MTQQPPSPIPHPNIWLTLVAIFGMFNQLGPQAMGAEWGISSRCSMGSICGCVCGVVGGDCVAHDKSQVRPVNLHATANTQWSDTKSGGTWSGGKWCWVTQLAWVGWGWGGAFWGSDPELKRENRRIEPNIRVACAATFVSLLAILHRVHFWKDTLFRGIPVLIWMHS